MGSLATFRTNLPVLCNAYRARRLQRKGARFRGRSRMLAHDSFQWRDAVIAACDGSRRGAGHSICERTEEAHAGLVGSHRRRNNLIATRWSSGHARQSKAVSALCTGGKLGVDQTGAGRTRRSTRRAAQGVKRAGVTDFWIGCVIRYLRTVDGTHRTDRRGFVRRHARTQQVGNGNRSDDQNDCHHNQQLDQREAIPFS